MPTNPTICWYDQNAALQAERYESVDSADVFEWSSGILPDPPGLVIDLGAGSGRDAAWFAARGFQVVAAEPAARMRAEKASAGTAGFPSNGLTIGFPRRRQL